MRLTLRAAAIFVRRPRQLSSSVHTTRVYGPCSRAVNTGVRHGCPVILDLDTHVYGPCSRAPVHTTREHGPSTRSVNTGTGNVYRAPVNTVSIYRCPRAVFTGARCTLPVSVFTGRVNGPC